MKFYAIGILVLAVLGFLSWGGHALYQSGFDKRVGEESKVYAAAEDKGRQAQSDADQQTIGQLRQALVDEQQAEAAHQKQLAALQAGKADLQRRLDDVSKQPDAAAWLAGRVPDDVLCSLQQPPTGSGAPAGCPSH